MIKMNEYFGEKIKSLESISKEGRFTTGIILPGEYNFDTIQEEHITVTLGDLDIRLSPREEWKKIQKGQTIAISAGVKFYLRADKVVAYLCLYK